jgi:hypothetical protein
MILAEFACFSAGKCVLWAKLGQAKGWAKAEFVAASVSA